MLIFKKYSYTTDVYAGYFWVQDPKSPFLINTIRRDKISLKSQGNTGWIQLSIFTPRNFWVGAYCPWYFMMCALRRMYISVNGRFGKAFGGLMYYVSRSISTCVAHRIIIIALAV